MPYAPTPAPRRSSPSRNGVGSLVASVRARQLSEHLGYVSYVGRRFILVPVFIGIGKIPLHQRGKHHRSSSVTASLAASMTLMAPPSTYPKLLKKNESESYPFMYSRFSKCFYDILFAHRNGHFNAFRRHKSHLLLANFFNYHCTGRNSPTQEKQAKVYAIISINNEFTACG